MEDLGEILVIILFFGLSIGMFVGLIVLVLWLRKRNVQKWQAFAEEHGLQCPDPGYFGRPEITGRFRNHAVQLYIYSTGGKNKQTYTVAKVFLEQPPKLGMRIYKEGFFSKVGKAIGTQDIQVGDQAFDDAVMIKGDDEVGIADYLTPELRSALLQLIGTEPQINFDDSGAQLTMHGWVTDPSRLGPLLEQMEEVCQLADGGAPSAPAGAVPAASGAGWTAEAPSPQEPGGLEGGFRVTTLPDGSDQD